MSPMLDEWWSLPYWRKLFTVKYWRHRKVVIQAHKELKLVHPEWTWFKCRAVAWTNELEKELKEGVHEFG